MSLNKATLEIFNKVLIDGDDSHQTNDKIVVVPSLLKKYSCVVSQDVLNDISEEKLNKLLSKTTSLDKMNNTFFTFLQTQETSDEMRIIHQLTHYFTTYGHEAIFGEVNPDFYLPVKDLSPEYNGNETRINIRVIRSMTAAELNRAICDILYSNAGINTAHLSSWRVIFQNFYDDEALRNLLNSPDVKNRDMLVEIANLIYPKYIPEDIDLMVRLAILRATGVATKINSRQVLQKLRSPEAAYVLTNYLNQYGDRVAVQNMAKVWRRNRKYLLAIKHCARDADKTIINRARKAANKSYVKVNSNHPVLNATTVDDIDSFNKALDSCSISQLVRVFNACSFRKAGMPFFMTRIRNGSVWIDNKKLNVPKNNDNFIKSLHCEFGQRKKLDGVKVYIPEGVNYLMPSSARDMVGFVPNYTSIDLPESDLAVGIHWYNTASSCVDLDLSFMGMNGCCISWNCDWKDATDEIIFSGDITSAPKNCGGAAEFVSMSKDKKLAGRFGVCLYSPSKTTELPSDYTYTLFINAPDNLSTALKKKNNYLLKAGRTIFSAKLNVAKANTSIGYISKEGKFIVSNLAINSTNVANLGDTETLEWVEKASDVKLSVSDFVKMSGGFIVSEKADADISLDFPDLTAQTWVDLGAF